MRHADVFRSCVEVIRTSAEGGAVMRCFNKCTEMIRLNIYTGAVQQTLH